MAAPPSSTPAASTAGLGFRETMSGPFTLGATDPQEGARAGAPVLAMHAAIHIDDIAGFVNSSSHLARLSGTIDYAPLGTGLVAPSGVFGLFSPSGDPALTWMVYELAFEHAGQPRYLAGRKHVRLGPPWKLWHETTTLYTTLHAGRDRSGRVIGAGTLSLGVGALLDLLGTVQGTGAGSGQRVGAVLQFFRYFSAELARTYLLRRPR